MGQLPKASDEATFMATGFPRLYFTGGLGVARLWVDRLWFGVGAERDASISISTTIGQVQSESHVIFDFSFKIHVSLADHYNMSIAMQCLVL